MTRKKAKKLYEEGTSIIIALRSTPFSLTYAHRITPGTIETFNDMVASFKQTFGSCVVFRECEV